VKLTTHPPSSVEVEEWVELYFHSPNTPSWRGAQLGGAQGQLYLFTLPLWIYTMREWAELAQSVKCLATSWTTGVRFRVGSTFLLSLPLMSTQSTMKRVLSPLVIGAWSSPRAFI
jgi:hypothetical protein